MEAGADSDEALLTRYAAGDAAAFERLYRRHELRVWRYLKRNVANTALAEELMQEVWFAAAREAGRFRPSARFTTWLFTIAHNRMVDAWRARRPQTSLDAAARDATALVAPPGDRPEARAIAGEERAALVMALLRLPDEQREAFLLQMEGDLAVEDIARVTGTTFETAKSRLRYARQKLRELLEEHA
jgi:RNA polymerase sigma-70 factor (ECF subfamily)